MKGGGNMKKKINKWKLSTIFLVIVFISLIFVNSYITYQNKKVSFNGVEISNKEINSFSKLFPDEDSFRVCDMEEHKCVEFTRIG